MRVGVLITSVSNFGEKGFYNSQEIGLAKELDKLFDEVIVYKAARSDDSKVVDSIRECLNSMLYQIPVKNWGINGLWDCSLMDTTIEALIYFSDTQISVPKVYKWCVENHVKFFPYIGVTKSHSTNMLKKVLIDLLFIRNVMVYKKVQCFAKTKTVADELLKRGVKHVTITPVGLDLDLLHKEFNSSDINVLKNKYGYKCNEKILLYVGRMTEEKQPLRMVRIFKRIFDMNYTYRLLMIGKGELLDDVRKEIADYPVTIIEKMPNDSIWECYRIADAFVNLNHQEIFGMSILEAMYYNCKVVAWRAPGPELIIRDGSNGWIVDDDDDVISKIIDKNMFDSHDYIVENFTWKNTATKMCNYVAGRDT